MFLLVSKISSANRPRFWIPSNFSYRIYMGVTKHCSHKTSSKLFSKTSLKSDQKTCHKGLSNTCQIRIKGFNKIFGFNVLTIFSLLLYFVGVWTTTFAELSWQWHFWMSSEATHFSWKRRTCLPRRRRIVAWRISKKSYQNEKKAHIQFK